MKNIGDFYLKIFSFLEVKFSIYLNRRVFVMFESSFSAIVRKYCFGLIAYNRAIVYKPQNFLKVVVHVIIIDQSNQTAR